MIHTIVVSDTYTGVRVDVGASHSGVNDGAGSLATHLVCILGTVLIKLRSTGCRVDLDPELEEVLLAHGSVN